MSDIEKDLVQIIRLALTGKDSDLRMYAKRALAPILKRRPDLSEMGVEVATLLDSTRGTRGPIIDPLPVDLDSRQELIRRELDPQLPERVEWPSSIQVPLNQLVEERKQNEKLLEVGLSPSRTLLFVGPPGVGKTLAARWFAKQISRPLLTLDLATVMSSYLGKTGNNIRVVLDYAKKSPSVLLLDEFDAIAKRRDDGAEVGELKRLVTVLLQAIDDWPTDGVLIAATNHPELLDPAVWRRFDRILEFPQPGDDLRRKLIEEALSTTLDSLPEPQIIELLTAITAKKSFSEIRRELDRFRRQALVSGDPIGEVLTTFIRDQMNAAPSRLKLTWAKSLVDSGYSQHRIHDVTGLSRDTIRRHFSPIKSKRRSSTTDRER